MNVVVFLPCIDTYIWFLHTHTHIFSSSDPVTSYRDNLQQPKLLWLSVIIIIFIIISAKCDRRYVVVVNSINTGVRWARYKKC